MTCCERKFGGPVDAYTGVMDLDPVEDVHLVGAYDDDIVVRRNYSSGREHPVDYAQVKPYHQRAFMGVGWASNLQMSLVTAGSGSWSFIQEDGESHPFNRIDCSDLTGRGWKLQRSSGACGDAPTDGLTWTVTAEDGRIYTLDEAGRLTTRKTRGGGEVRFGYDDDEVHRHRLKYVKNSTGQIAFGYGEHDRLETISLEKPESARRHARHLRLS